MARRDGATGTGGVFYYFSDHLKTASVITDSAGVIKAESDYYPWGGELQFVNNDSNDYKFTGKKRDLETGLDYFGARYYSNGLGRWVSADWSAAPVPVPYADFGDPQSLNLYGYVRGLPTTRMDADGHCCSFGEVMDFLGSAVNAYASDNLLGAGRMESGTRVGQLGSAVGDAVATLHGVTETMLGATGEAGGFVLDATGVGAVIGVPANVVSAGVMMHGSSTAINGIVHLSKSASDSSGSSSSTGTQESSKPHGNTAGDQPAELYEKHDANGNFEKHGVSQNASKRYTKKEVNGGTVKVTDRGPRKEMLTKERHNVETNPGPKNKEPWAGKKKNSTD